MALRQEIESEILPAKTLDSTRPWHVLYVRSNCEKMVVRHLTVRAIEYYLPLYRERVRWSDRVVVTERPLFPGYIFARFATSNSMPALTAPGVIRSLDDKNGSMVSAVEITQIQEGLLCGLTLRPHPELSAGMQVRVRSGVFSGTVGMVAELRRRCKVILSFASMQQCVSLEVDRSQLEVLPTTKRPKRHNRKLCLYERK